MNIRRSLLYVAAVAATSISALAFAAKPTANDGAGAYATGLYRDLFAEQGHNQTESRAKIDAAFQQLFHGDNDHQALYYEVGSNAMVHSPTSPMSPTTTPAPKACPTG
jgi:oligosaccharide reducing-end xylanase